MPGRDTRVVHVVAAPEFARLILRHELRHLGSGSEHWIVSSPGKDLDLLAAEGWQVAPIAIHRKIAPLTDLVTLVRLTALLRDLRPDLVHTYTPKAGLLGQLAAVLAGVRWRVHGCRGLLYHPGMSPTRRWLARMVDRVTCGLAHRVLFVSRADLEHLVQEGLCERSKARHTGNGVDLSLFRRTETFLADRSATRAALGYGPNDVVVLTVGRFVADKGYLDLAGAIRRLTTPLDHLRFLWVAPVMAGEDGVIPDAIFEEPPLRESVRRVERRDDMRQVYQAADLLVHASHREGVPRVLMEAAVSGLPIVASDIPGNREVVEFGRTAIGFAPGDPAALAAALDEALSDRPRAEILARGANADVLDRMSVASVATRVRAAYRELGLALPSTPSAVEVAR